MTQNSSKIPNFDEATIHNSKYGTTRVLFSKYTYHGKTDENHVLFSKF